MTVNGFRSTDDVVWEVTKILFSNLNVEGISISMDEIVDCAVQGVSEAKIAKDAKPESVWPEDVTPYDLSNAVTKAVEALIEVARPKLIALGVAPDEIWERRP